MRYTLLHVESVLWTQHIQHRLIHFFLQCRDWGICQRWGCLHCPEWFWRDQWQSDGALDYDQCLQNCLCIQSDGCHPMLSIRQTGQKRQGDYFTPNKKIGEQSSIKSKSPFLPYHLLCSMAFTKKNSRWLVKLNIAPPWSINKFAVPFYLLAVFNKLSCVKSAHSSFIDNLQGVQHTVSLPPCLDDGSLSTFSL